MDAADLLPTAADMEALPFDAALLGRHAAVSYLVGQSYIEALVQGEGGDGSGGGKESVAAPQAQRYTAPVTATAVAAQPVRSSDMAGGAGVAGAKTPPLTAGAGTGEASTGGTVSLTDEQPAAGHDAAWTASLRRLNDSYFAVNWRCLPECTSLFAPVRVRPGLAPPLPLLPGRTQRLRHYAIPECGVGEHICPWLWCPGVLNDLMYPGVEPDEEADSANTKIYRLADGDLNRLAQLMWDDFGIMAQDSLPVRQDRFLLSMCGGVPPRPRVD